MSMIFLYIFLVFIISFIFNNLLSRDQLDLVMFVPGAVAIIISFKTKKNILTIFQIKSFKYILSGMGISIIAATLTILISLIFNFVNFFLPKEVLEYTNGSTLQALARIIFIGFPYLLVLNSIFTLGEELGWRGFLQNNIKTSISSFYIRSLVVGLIWGLWHVPIYSKMGISSANMIIFLINVCIISILYGYLFEKSNSIWPTVLAHSSHNALFNSIIPSVLHPVSKSEVLFGETGLIVTLSYLIIIMVFYFRGKISYNLIPKTHN